MEALKYMRNTNKSSLMKLLKFTTRVLLLSLLIVSCSSETDNKTSSKKTKPLEQLDPYSARLYPAQKEAKARDFTVDLVNGGTFSLSDQKGKVVMLNIWATWCAPCREEVPDFVELYDKYQGQGLSILGVSIDKKGESEVKPFMEKYNMNYPVVVDRGTIMDKYGPTMGIPTTYIIGRDGNLRYFAVGAVTKKELEPRLKKLLTQ